MGYVHFFFLSLSALLMIAGNTIAKKPQDAQVSEGDENPLSAHSQNKVNVYFLSGLGADERVFQNLQLDTSQLQIRHIKWIDPKKNEPLESYARRLTAQIDTTERFHLVGLSFGGIMVSELSRIIHPDKMIIISSTPTGIPVSRFYQRLLKIFLFHPLAGPFLRSPNKLVYKYFGANTPEMKTLLKQILKDTDSKFLKWALVRISAWDYPVRNPGIYHIHGTADKLIPIKLLTPDVRVEGGGHLMVYAQHQLISKLLNAHLTGSL